MSKVILYGVLNWGLGHATRSIPFIYKLLKDNHKLIIASDGDALALLKKEFGENVIFETLPSYNIKYTKKRFWFHLNLVKQTPHILQNIKAENKVVAALVEKYQPQQIISDHRYGVYHLKVHSIFLGHQLFLDFPQNKLIEKIANNLHRQKIDVFNEIQVPDLPPPNNISGKLSNYQHPNIHYIGTLSRMQKMETVLKYDICVVLSGPEPQRTVLEDILIKQLENTHYKVAFIRGLIEEEYIVNNEHKNIEILNYCHTKELNKILMASKVIICRSGYSSIMDLVKLQKQAILIPTPELPEQNYLAKRMFELGWFYTVEQENFDIEKAMKDYSKFKVGLLNADDPDLAGNRE